MTPTEIDAATSAYIDSLGPEALAKAAAYTMGNHWLMLGGLLFSAVVTFLIVRSGMLVRLEGRFGPRSSRGIFLIGAVYTVLSTLFTLPWTLYESWWRETNFGRTSQPLGDYLSQAAIGTGISAIVLSIFFVLVYFLIRRAERTWWIWSGGLVAAFISVLLLLGPVLIEPLFNSYEPVPEGEVRTALEAMAAEADIPADRIFMFDGSRQSNNFTANVSGIGSSARIAISDIAIGGATLDEVKAVTGHEIGHYVLGHIWRIVVTLSGLAIVLFFVSDLIFAPVARFFGASGNIADPSSLPVLIFVLGFFSTLAQPVQNAVVRMGETEADRYSLETVNLPDALASALVKTAEYRDPRPHPLQEALFYTHPSVERRVHMAMEWKAANGQTPPQSGT
ncbi:MAG: M48 family metallopeptidase [Pseudomonadota bacterium]